MWALELVGFLLLGLGVVVGAVVALPFMIAKAAGHDQATCDCWDCQGRRARAVEKAKNRGGTPVSPSEMRDPKDYWSTSQLRTAYHVIVKGAVYKVISIRTMADGNTKVGLQNVLTEIHTMIIITRKMHEAKIWRKGSAMDGL